MKRAFRDLGRRMGRKDIERYLEFGFIEGSMDEAS
jgi:hypothetical protein